MENIRKQICDNVVKVLKNENVDETTIKQFEKIFWNETRRYSFSKKKTYAFEDFKLEEDNGSLILDGEYGMKLQISAFNPLVPTYYRNKALDVLNGFIDDNDIVVDNTDSLAAMLEIYIDENVNVNTKYRIVIYLWNEERTEMENGYVISVPILATEEHFSEFRRCVMDELRYLTFGKMVEV